MIFLFTSDHCTWCDVLKSMLEEEWSDLGISDSILEVDIGKHTHIVEAFDVFVVPTLVAGNHKISGVPSSDDLRSFLIQALSLGEVANTKQTTQAVFRGVRAIRDSVREPPQVTEVAPI
ncbi:MAG: glutaredoxin family protein [Candidatus Thorarchaeota archaeon]